MANTEHSGRHATGTSTSRIAAILLLPPRHAPIFSQHRFARSSTRSLRFQKGTLSSTAKGTWLSPASSDSWTVLVGWSLYLQMSFLDPKRFSHNQFQHSKDRCRYLWTTLLRATATCPHLSHLRILRQTTPLWTSRHTIVWRRISMTRTRSVK